MSDKSDPDQEIIEGESKPLPVHQYSRKKLLDISKSPAALKRPAILEKTYDSDEGKWDPERWYKAKFGSRECSPLTLGDSSKDRRGRVIELDRDPKRRPSLNDPVERIKEAERDGIVLSPQRRSFGTGCHVTQTFTRQISIPEREREEPRADPRAERDRDRERPVRKVGSGRIQIDRENSRDLNPRDFSSLRSDPHDDRDRERPYGWRGERERDRGDRERDRGDRDWDRERERDYNREGDWTRDNRDRDRDRRFERSDRFQRGGERDRDFPDRDRRDYRDRGFDDRSSRRRNNYREEKEPEWFTSGPISQTDTIELRGFEKDTDIENEDPNIVKKEPKKDSEESSNKSVKASKESADSEDVPGNDVAEADVILSQCSSPEVDQQNHQLQTPDVVSGHRMPSPQQLYRMPSPQELQHIITRMSPENTLLDFDKILQASFPIEEGNVRQGSRFTQFFSARLKDGSPSSSIEDMLVPQDLLDDRLPSPAVPSPQVMMGPMGAMPQHHFNYLQHFQEQQHLQQMHQQQQHFHDLQQRLHEQQQQAGGQPKEPSPVPQAPMAFVPNPAGDNQGGQTSKSKAALPPSVTALFNTAAAIGGSSACKWKPPLNCSVETLESSLFTNSAVSSNSSFSTQDAEAQLKAMLFGGTKDSASSSGTASPSNLPPSVQRKVKTVAELEADMHLSSPKKVASPKPPPMSNAANQAGDMTAFNKLLIMMNAASEANQNAPTSEQSGGQSHGMLPGNTEFNHALMRNKEEQLNLLHQSMQNTHQPTLSQQQQPPPHPQHSMPQLPNPVAPPPFMQQAPPAMPPPLNMSHGIPPGISNKGLTSHSLTPQAMSTPHALAKPRAHSGGPIQSGDPIFNLIQQNPSIVMNPPSPGPASLAAILASQQTAVSSTARVPSPLMFSQQPPRHLNAPSPIHPTQLSPRSMTVGANLTASTMPSSSGMRSPVPPRIPSPQELSLHAQQVMYNALLKKQIQDQSERSQKKHQENAKSPSQMQHINVVKPPPSAQAVMPPNQPKGASLDTFTPTSVLRKMHSDKAAEKEKQVQEVKSYDETEFMPSMQELSVDGAADHKIDSFPDKSEFRDPALDDLNDISFLDPVNPNLVSLSSQLDNSLRIGQTNILPGSLSQPMSVEEKLKLSRLAAKPGCLSQMLDAAERNSSQGRPIVKAPVPSGPLPDVVLSQQQQSIHQMLGFQQMQQQPPPVPIGSRPVTGGLGVMKGALPPFSSAPPVSSPSMSGPQFGNNSNKGGAGGRAIVGSSSVQQQSQPATNNDIMRLLEQQQQLHQMQRMAQPPPPLPGQIHHMGPPPVGLPIGGHMPMMSAPMNNAAAMQHQQMARAHAANAQRNHLLAMQQRGMAPLPPLHTMGHGQDYSSSHSPKNAGPLSPAAMSAAIQRVVSPHGAHKMNGPPVSSMNGKPDMNIGIQRWFSPDILKHQLPSMPPLPTQGSHVMTVDELERI